MLRKEKKCKNPECEEPIQFFDNPKKLYCNDTCKSRYHYLKDLEENEEIIWIEKALRLNYKIIKNFINKGVYVVNSDVIKALGFNMRVYIDIEQKFFRGLGYKSLRRIKDVFYRYDIIENNIILYY
jgi:hypothetical protein